MLLLRAAGVVGPSNAELGFGASATRMGGVGVSRELNNLVVLELQRLLEAPANLEKNLLALLLGPSLASVTGDGTADGTCPKTNTVEASPHVDHNTHDLVVVLILQVLANGCQHNMKPERIDVDSFFVLELKCPLTTMLVLGVFPFGTDALLEEMVVGLERKIGRWGDVVLNIVLV